MYNCYNEEYNDSGHKNKEGRHNLTMERKLVKIGNSLGLTLPQAVLKHLNAKQGDGVVFRLQDDSTVNIEKQKKIELPQGVDLDFIKMVNEVMDEYDKAIKELTKR